MRSLFYTINVGLSVLLLSSCQMGGGIEPSVTTLILPYEARTASCTDYRHESKNGDRIELGAAKGDILLVGFSPNLSLEAKQSILATYPFYERTDGDITMDSGLITKVILRPQTTCFEVEKIIKDLQKHPEVLFASPTFAPSAEQLGTYDWVGLSNEVFVSLEESTSLTKFETAVANSNSKVAFSLTDKLHVVSVNKTSSGNALAVAQQLNALPFVVSAEPNLIYNMPPSAVESARSINSLEIINEMN